MKLHPRVHVVRDAAIEHGRAWVDIMARHGLTAVEALHVLARAQTTLYRALLRMERHPGEPDKAADEE